MEPASTGELILAFILIGFSAFFSIAETSLTVLSKFKIRTMIEERKKGARNIEKATENRDQLLSSILIGSNAANVALSAIATAFALSLAGSNAISIAIATAAVTLIVLIFCDIMPKTIAMKYPERMSLLVVRPMQFFISVFTPISTSLNFIIFLILKPFGFSNNQKDIAITESELKTMLEVGVEEGVIEQDEQEMMGKIMEFENALAKDVMTPRTEMTVISLDFTYDDVLEVFSKAQLSRLPVYQDSIDNIVGVLHLKDFILADGKKAEFTVEQYMREPFFTLQLKHTRELLKEMSRKKTTLAIILDEYGGTAGLLSIEDLIEEIVGEIFDEHDQIKNEVEYAGENEYVIIGSMKIDDFNELAGSNLTSEEYDSVGGYVMGLAGSIPKAGDIFYDNDSRIFFSVEEVEKNRIERLLIKVETSEYLKVADM